MAIDANKLQELMDKMFGDVGAAMGSALVLLGDKFGFYKTACCQRTDDVRRIGLEIRHR